MEGGNRSVVGNMEDMSGRFPDIYNKYFSNEFSDTQLQEITTQPYWQSMRLTKKRLDSKGLQMHLETTEHFDRIMPQNSSLQLNEDGYNIIGFKRKTVVAENKFSLNGRRLRTVPNYEYLNLYMLQGKVEGEMAICPNCGHEGRLSEYIDGCDSCGALFTVKDFETKVSGYSMEENTTKKLKITMRRSFTFLAILTIILMVLGFVSVVTLALQLQSGNDGMDAVSSLWRVIFSMDMVPLCIKCLIYLVIIFFSLQLIFMQVYRERVRGQRKIQSMIPDFSGEDFCQNLEYKLRNIHMTNKASEVEAFASFPMDDVIKKYDNVVDCCVTRCKFTDVSQQSDKYELKALVTMRLTLLKGRRIRSKYEKIMLALSVRKEVAHRKETALREYKCEGCHFSINLLEGRSCKYCGTVIDYSKYGWKIDDYRIQRTPANVHKIASGVLLVTYILVFASHLFALNNAKGDNWLSLHKEIEQSYAEWKALCEEVPMPDDADENVIQLSNIVDQTIVMNSYKAENIQSVMDKYLPLLQEEEFILDEKLTEDHVYTLYKKAKILDDEGYIFVMISAKNELILVSICADDELPDSISELENKMAP